jgi:hypothetical protein
MAASGEEAQPISAVVIEKRKITRLIEDVRMILPWRCVASRSRFGWKLTA